MASTQSPNECQTVAHKDETPPRTGLMTLPAELRLMIYEHLLNRGRDDHTEAHPQILATCTLIRQEADPILYNSITFVICQIRSLHKSMVVCPLDKIARRIDNITSENIWSAFEYFQEKMHLLRKFRSISIMLPASIRDFCRTTERPPAEGLLYILGSLLVDGALKELTLTFSQPAIDFHGIWVSNHKVVKDFAFKAPLFSPQVRIICSGFTVPMRDCMVHAAQQNRAVIRKNVLRPWAESKEQLRQLILLLNEVEMMEPSFFRAAQDDIEMVERDHCTPCPSLCVASDGRITISRRGEVALEASLSMLSALLCSPEVRRLEALALEELAARRVSRSTSSAWFGECGTWFSVTLWTREALKILLGFCRTCYDTMLGHKYRG